MRKLILIAILTTSIISCKENKTSNSNNKITNIENLIPGPIVHESLSNQQLEKIKFIQKTFNEVYPFSLEKTITNFKRDQNPDNEINVWLGMSKAFQMFALKNSREEKLKFRKEAFKLILMRSMMTEEEAINSSELKVLSEKEIQEILKNYTLEAKPITLRKQ
ncbi:hypothetical protein [Tenacibaculum ovolyticum]|uniref:hypothetical protein n=1 Tax=Tenacibaculum ovolyticum TaxID=104270 RepID=UPI0007EC2ECA|nr:hypothetical protein [Tenacibaculum ovolyticum]